VFVPRREHARFCGVGCRATWNAARTGDPLVDASTLLWSVTAMSHATGRLPRVAAWDRARGYTVIGEAVWWVTLVDATLVRHHAEVYDIVAGQFATQRPLIEATLAGLRFVRNQAGDDVALATFVQGTGAGPGTGDARITGWRWQPVPPPVLVDHPRAQAWEMSRYEAYQACLAGRTIGEIFRRAATFLTLTAANAGSPADLAGANASHRPA
jgi:hypothetical protein